MAFFAFDLVETNCLLSQQVLKAIYLLLQDVGSDWGRWEVRSQPKIRWSASEPAAYLSTVLKFSSALNPHQSLKTQIQEFSSTTRCSFSSEVIAHSSSCQPSITFYAHGGGVTYYLLNIKVPSQLGSSFLGSGVDEAEKCAELWSSGREDQLEKAVRKKLLQSDLNSSSQHHTTLQLLCHRSHPLCRHSLHLPIWYSEHFRQVNSDIYFLNKSKNILLKIFTVSWKKSEVSLKNTEKSLKTNM